MHQDALISLQNIIYKIGANTLLEDISLTIKKNQIVTIIGHNGSGKSTLLKMILGSIQPTGGFIQRREHLTIGYVPQKISFSQTLPITVHDFLRIYNTNLHSTLPVPCSLLNIQSLMNTPINGLSGGQMQKILIYNALLGDPNVLLLDEPTAGLDIQAQQEFYALIEHIHEKHAITIILVSHDIHTVYSKADSVICLHKGICCTGSPHDTGFSQEMHSLLGPYVVPYLHSHTDTNDG